MNDSWFPGATIERIDDNDHYNRQNCKWATRKEQSANRRVNKIKSEDIPRIFHFREEGFTVKQIGQILGVRPKHISKILYGEIWKEESLPFRQALIKNKATPRPGARQDALP